ncbi:zinc-dependent alcohol dehydrogenase [Paenibacillus mesophilus]|uniref:zinc-dependent alcohol dehydrogenase n=1 Tax=Paenibacillus mesophilus TaxID=2582849 RepID=UPI001EE4B34F|nr:zinc-binding alcohol dehydrogenase [Paenibacillus mesophilus]
MDIIHVTIAREGEIRIEQQEKPVPGEHEVLVKTEYSAISNGTETMVLNNRSSGTRLGYNSVARIVAKGAGVEHLAVGQRVACYGEGAHADYRLVPKVLAVPVPDHVDSEEATFAGLGAIAIHALRQARLQFGETVVIVGLGILGQITAQIAHAAAYEVIGCDLLPERCEQLRAACPGITVCSDAAQVGEALVRRGVVGLKGADSVLLCGGGKGDGLLDQAIGWLRDRGSVVIVGVPDTVFTRNALFHKEAEIRISRAGGPGRYDERYERGGYDYPGGYVRWTEGRNVGEFVRLLADKRISIKPLVRHRFAFNQIADAYRLCREEPERTLGIVLRY